MDGGERGELAFARTCHPLYTPSPSMHMAVASENTETAILARILEAHEGNLTAQVAESWLRLSLPAADEKRLRELTSKAKTGSLSQEDEVLLENYLDVGRLLDVMKSKARLSLSQLKAA
jgi:hypothetical protein